MNAEIVCLKRITSIAFNNKSEYSQHDGFLDVPRNAIVFHLNESVLYSTNKSNHFYEDKSILLVGCGSIKRTSVLKSLKLLNFRKFVCLHKNKQNWAEWAFDDWILADHEDISNKEKTKDTVKNYMNTFQIKFDAIMTYDDYCVLMTSFLTTELKYPGIPFGIIEKIKNKYNFRSLCVDLEINSPRFFSIKSSERKEFLSKITKNNTVENDSFFEKCTFPIIVKNTYGCGKDFVRKCSSPSILKECIEDSIRLSKDIDLIVEEYFEGIEIDIDILIKENSVKFLIISDNFPALQPSFLEQGGITPSIKLKSSEIESIKSIVCKWLSKINFENGLLHFEAKYDPLTQVLMPIEINPRLGGSETWSNIKACCGVDLIREHLNICLGLNVSQVNAPTLRSISKNFLAENTSLESIKLNWVELEKEIGLIELAVFKPVGETCQVNETIGWISVRSSETSETRIINKLNEILLNLKFEFKQNYFIENNK